MLDGDDQHQHHQDDGKRLVVVEKIEGDLEVDADATRAEATTKIDNFMPMIGYPDAFETYEGMEIRAGDALGNRMRAIRWAIDDNRRRLGGPVDKTQKRKEMEKNEMWMSSPSSLQEAKFSKENRKRKQKHIKYLKLYNI